MKRLFASSGLVLTLLCSHVWAMTPFKISAIRFKGLTHTARATALSYADIAVGDTLDNDRADDLIERLYATGFFSNVTLRQAGQTLWIDVAERPVIAKVTVKGEQAIKSSQVDEILEKVGLTVGQPYQQNLVKSTVTVLQKSYTGLGYYGVKIDTEVKKLPRDRVAVTLGIHEGKVASVKQIRIIGLHAFTEKQLTSHFELQTPRFWSSFFHDDRFSPEKLDADLETLRSFYYDRGYMDFKVTSSQVSLTPDGQGVYVVIHAHEGKPYHISEVKLTGNLDKPHVGREALANKLDVKAGQVFSRKRLLADVDRIKSYLGDWGYAYPKVDVSPDLDRAKQTAKINVDVQPGHIIYVRHVRFAGNTQTADEVLRRAARQFEGSRFSFSNLEESKRRMRNLSYIGDVGATVEPVPGHPDQVDIDFSMKEKSSAQFNFQVGYSDAYGLLYGINWQQPNALGSGRDFTVALQRSQFQSSANVSFFEPYFTRSGISQDVGFSYMRTTPEKVDLSNYRMDTTRGYLHYGFPLSPHQTLGLGASLERDELHTSASTPSQIANFVTQYGDDFTQVNLNMGWHYSNLDQAVFPTKGWMHHLGLSVSESLGDNALHFATTNYSMAWYTPLASKWVLHARTKLRYGFGYGGTDDLPPYKHFYTGGIGSVAGYEPNGLGPKDSKGKPLGGAIALDGSLSLVIPTEFSDQARIYAFVDAGNVYKNSLDLGQLRYAAGVGMIWKTILPIQFALAKAINPSDSDATRLFDFTIGMSL